MAKIIDPVVQDTATEVISANALKALQEYESLPLKEAMDVWKTLPPPTPFTGIDGEYMGRFAAQYRDYDEIDAWMMAGFKDSAAETGYWLRKCYRPYTTVVGEGYNVFQLPDGTVVRRARFSTHIGASRFDGNLALIMAYASFKRTDPVQPMWKGDTNDDVRQLEEGVYIGCAHMRLDTAVSRNHPGLAAMRANGIGHPDPATVEIGGYTSMQHDVQPSLRTPGTLFILTGPVAEYTSADDPESEDV